MIAFLTGRVAHKDASSCVLDVGGVGLKLHMSSASLASLPREGDDVTVHTYLHVREDELTLFGFESGEERTLFGLLITVSGVGPKVALSVLSALKPDALRDAVSREDSALLASVPGIGKKTAERIILELRDKLGAPDLERGRAAVSGALGDARDALLAMGFSSTEVAVALKGADESGGTQELVRRALRRLGGRT